MSLRGLFLLSLVGALLLPATLTAEPPSKVPVQGYLTNAEGVPIQEQTPVDITLYKTKEGSESVHTESFTVEPEDGAFTVYLGSNKTLDLAIFRNNASLWAEIEVAGEALDPRLEVATAPYAAVASHAEHATNAENAVQAQNASMARDAAQLNGKAPSHYRYSAGQGLSISANQTFSVDRSTVEGWVHSSLNNRCGSSEIAIGLDQNGGLICKTAVSRIGSGQITSTHIGTGAVKSDEIADGQVTRYDIKAGAVRSSQIKDETVTGSDIANGTIQGIDIGSDAVTSAEIDDKTIQGGDISDDSLTGSKIQDGSVQRKDLEPYECTNSASSGNTVLLVPGGSSYTGAGCPLNDENRAGFLPTCAEAPVGALCRYNANCSSIKKIYSPPSGLGNCGGESVYYKGET